MIPGFSKYGVLPEGIHTAAMAEVEARFATDEHRRRLWDGLTRYLSSLAALKEHRLMKSIVFGGSFLTNKENPKDIDILVEITRRFGAACIAEPRFPRLFDHAVTKPYGVQAKPWSPTAPEHLNLLMLWQKPSPNDIRVRGMSPNDRKGVVQVP